MNYQVSLEIFEGPLDLLLHLIRSNEVDIYDIPIAKITEQYLEYLERMRSLDLEIGGEFLVMATTLMRIKARMLLPITKTEGEEEDPRKDLVLQLLEYKKFKEAGKELKRLEWKQRHLYGRPALEKWSKEVGDDTEYPRGDILALFLAYKKLLERIRKDRLYRVLGEYVSVEERMEHIMKILNERNEVSFYELIQDSKKKIVLVATFMGILELARLARIEILQKELFGEIMIKNKLQFSNNNL